MKRLFFVTVLGAALFVPLAGCTTQGVNSTGSVTTVGQQVSAAGYSSYITATGAWLAYLTANPVPNPDVVEMVETARKAARAALDAAAEAPNDPIKQAVAATSMAMFTKALVSNKIEVK